MDRQLSPSTTSTSSTESYLLTMEQVTEALHTGVVIAERLHLRTSLALLREIYAAVVETQSWYNFRPGQPADREFIERMVEAARYAYIYAEMIQARFAYRCMLRLFVRLRAHLGFIEAKALVAQTRALCARDGVTEDSLEAMCLFCGITVLPPLPVQPQDRPS